ncbi:MAG: hypothetical protein LBG88_01095 [Christensenellaceae bacterium]|nr:hypothetical protein [Christensenellaceae bacterium]
MLKNWYRIFYIIFCATGVVLYLSVFILKPRDVSIEPSLVCFLLGPVAYFVGTIAYNALKMFKKSDQAACYTQIATGLVATMLLCIGAQALYRPMGMSDLFAKIAGASMNDEGGIVSPDMALWYSQIFVSVAFFGQMFVFGLMPLVKGISKTTGITPEYKFEIDHPEKTTAWPTNHVMLGGHAESKPEGHVEVAHMADVPKPVEQKPVATPKVEVKPASVKKSTAPKKPSTAAAKKPSTTKSAPAKKPTVTKPKK